MRSWFGTEPEQTGDATSTGGGPAATPAEIVASAQSDIGKVRLVNEDMALFSRPAAFDQLCRHGAIAMVADGMGGAQGGNIASEIAARVIPNAYHASEEEPAGSLRKALLAANREIYRRAREDRDLEGMGATCVLLAISPRFAWAAWVGDSRLYLIRNGQIFVMTQDHSLVNEMVRRGMLTAEQAATHEDRNVVTRALGSHAKLQPSVWDKPYPVHIGDRFLLCSDGVHDALSASEILEIAREGSVAQAAGRLLIAANDRGGYDNASAVVIELVRSSPAIPTREFRVPGWGDATR